MARRLSAWLLLFCTMTLVGCDHATKFAASTALRGKAVDVIPSVLDLQYTENHDVAFSLFRSVDIPHRPLLFLVLATIGVAFVAVMWWRQRHVATTTEHAGWSIVMAGALGNMADRWVHGYVVDFIHVRHWPVFNVADCLVAIGVFLLFLGRRKPRAPEAV
jgi:signal peptidase II